jgi:hypothetical protein
MLSTGLEEWIQDGTLQPKWLWFGLAYLYQLLLEPCILPIVPIFLSLHYTNERLRKEGWDLIREI